MSDKLRIQYIDDVPAGNGHRAFKGGETFTVRDIRSAKRLHPQAVILRHEDGRKYTGPGSLAEYAAEGKRIGDVLLKEADAYEEPETPPAGDGPETPPEGAGGEEGGGTASDTSTDGAAAPAAAKSGGKKSGSNGGNSRTG